MAGADRGMPASGQQLVVVGLGANLGARLQSLRRAAAELAELERVAVVGRSAVVASPALGGPPQPDYLNAALSLATSRPPAELLERALVIERRLGRRRPDAVRWGPRLIDIDLLWIRGVCVRQPGLKVPHPRRTERAFALQPLLELVPDATDPTTGQRYAALPAAQTPLERVAEL